MVSRDAERVLPGARFNSLSAAVPAGDDAKESGVTNDSTPGAPRQPLRVAVVGGGISGLGAARLLARVHDVVVFEAEARLGGHAHTHDVTVDGRAFRLDTGFLVFNEKTYPNFVRLLGELGVSSTPSDMALSVRCARCRLEYALRGPRSIFAQKRNLLRPAFYGLFRDLGRFFRDARRHLDANDTTPPSRCPPRSEALTVGQFLAKGRYGDEFVRHWLLPTAGALWSAPFGDIEAYSARHLLEFFRNHAFLERRQLAWRTVAGASRSYVDAIAKELGARVRLSSPVARVLRDEGGVTVTVRGAAPERFEAVVLACPATAAFAILGDADASERGVLSRFRYAEHPAVLHTDRSFLPKAKAAWAAWNCDIEDCRDVAAPASLTYYLNRLQGLSTDTTFCVTLNPRRPPEGAIATMHYAHPMLTADATRAQCDLETIQGRGGVHFAGAHLRHGFHEDGLVSGVAAAARLGVRW